MLKATNLFISSDVQTSLTPSASAVFAANSDLWPNQASMPPYAYQPFGVIWIGVNASSSDVSNRIVYKLGQNYEESRGEVTLLTSPIESVDFPNAGLQSNDVGAETAYLDLVFRLPEESQDWDRISNAELRVRWLIDENWRKHRKLPPYIPNLGDFTCSNVRFSWIRHMVPPNAKELWSRYLVCYNRLVPHA